ARCAVSGSVSRKRSRTDGTASGEPKLSDISLRSCLSVPRPNWPMPITRAGTTTPSLLPSMEGRRDDWGVGGANRSLLGVAVHDAPGVGETANGSATAVSGVLPLGVALAPGSDGGRAGRPSVGCVSIDGVLGSVVGAPAS